MSVWSRSEVPLSGTAHGLDDELTAKFATFIESAPDGIVFIDRSGRVLRVNASALQIFGYTRAQLEGMSVEQLIPARFRAPHPRHRAQFEAQPRSRPMGAGRELYCLRADGQEIPVEISLSPLGGERGLVCAIVSDVSDRRGVEERFRAALDALPDSFILLEGQRDAAGELKDFLVVGANHAALAALGRTREDCVGLRCSELFPERSEPELIAELRGILVQRQVHERVLALESAGQPGRRLRRQVVPVPPTGLVMIVQDITEEHLAYETSARLAAIVEASDDAIVGGTLDGTVTSWNHAAQRMFGYSADEAVGQRLSALLGAQDASGGADGIVALRCREGRRVFASVSASVIRDAAGQPVSASRILRDVTAQQNVESARLAAEERLRSSERLFASAFENAPIGIALVAPDGRWLRVNGSLCQILGYTPEELLRLTFQQITHPEDLSTDLEFVKQMLAGEIRSYEMEKRYFHRDGQIVWVQLNVSLVLDELGAPIHFVSQIQDITRRRRMEEELRETQRVTRASLKEKEVLLQEVHHRVKNNLQVIASLISMQMRRLDNASGRNALEECRARVRAIALIHEKLYRARNYAEVPFSEYLQGLVHSVFQASGVSPAHVKLRLDVAPVKLGVDKAIPCGLIVNELITNALKHAFPEPRRGSLAVSLTERAGRVHLRVSDDGVGLGPSFSLQQATTLGLQLVRTLGEQLGATVEFVHQPGATISVDFAHEDTEVES